MSQVKTSDANTESKNRSWIYMVGALLALVIIGIATS
jgi:hypothetical protein